MGRNLGRFRSMIFSRFRQKNCIYHVTVDQGQWVLYQIAVRLTEELKKRGRRAYITHNPWPLKHQILHFGDRYAYLQGPFQSLHPSNHVFLTWHHGDPKDPNVGMQQMFEKLPAAVPYFKTLVVSCEITRQHLLEWGMPAEKMIKIPIGVDVSRFSLPTPTERQRIRAELGIPDNAICIGSFQKDGEGWGDGMTPKLIKGPDIFLEVISNLAVRYANLMVLLTGPSRGYVKQGLEKIGVPYIHHFLENPAEIGRYYQALDLYLITSRVEGGPIALMESWASGIPVVSTRVGMPADLIMHGENGLLAEVEDTNVLTTHMTRLIEDTDLRRKFASAGVQAVKPLDWSCVAEQYDRLLYQSILGTS